MQVLRLNPAPTTWEEALQEFILRKQAEGASKRALDDYRKHVTRFFAEYSTCWPDKLKVACMSTWRSPSRLPTQIAKTWIARILPLYPATVEALKQLIAARPEEWKEVPVFCSQDGRPMHETSWATV